MTERSAAGAMRAVRALFEGAAPSLEVLAWATGRSQAYLARVARNEGWRGVAEADADPAGLERRLVSLSHRLVADLEAASAMGQATGGYDKGRIDALSAMLRMVEKIGEMARVPERAAEIQKRSDEELAAALALIDARIVELARELAASMGGGEAEGSDSVPGAG